MGKKEDNKKIILEAFGKEGSLTTSRIMELLHTSSKGTVKTYLSYLRDDGLIIEEKVTSHGAKTYSLLPDDTVGYEEITGKDWQDFIILSALGNANLDKPRIFRYSLINYILNEKELNIGLKKSALFEHINRLCEKGLISENNKTAPASLTPAVNIPVIIPFRFDEIFAIIRDLYAVPDGDPFYHSLNTIKTGIIEMSDALSIPGKDPVYHSRGRGYREKSIAEELSQHFGDNNYRKYVCDISYRHKDCDKKEVIRLCVGLIVYVVEKDKLYVIGRDTAKETGFHILNMDRIIGAREVRVKGKKMLNHHWKSREFLSIFSEMLSISTEPAQDVKIRFDDEYFIESRIEGLRKTRNNAAFEKRSGYIYYTDRIRGTSDLRNFLRTFTDRCIVISPKEMKKEMMENIKGQIKLYEKD